MGVKLSFISVSLFGGELGAHVAATPEDEEKIIVGKYSVRRMSLVSDKVYTKNERLSRR